MNEAVIRTYFILLSNECPVYGGYTGTWNEPTGQPF